MLIGFKVAFHLYLVEKLRNKVPDAIVNVVTTTQRILLDT